ncbi:MAG: hypothetical protein QOJ07_1225 [Thermoleophilaceae bacterium]|nr:hypothetical protein [Thermoleophilaceae bacterium]
MTLTRLPIKTLAAALLAFAATLTILALAHRGAGPRAARPAADAGPAPIARSLDARIRILQTQVRSGVGGVDTSALLADAYLQKVRETGDASWYQRAATVLEAAHRRDPRDSAVATGLGTLALARHDFRAGLTWGIEAHRLAPAVVRPLGVIVDAQVELGRYDDAARTLQRMVDLKPNLASYARVSYFRELHGDLGGALAAMRLALSAGGEAPENVAYVQTLIGTLEFGRGRLGAARLAYREALARVPGYVPARAGVARVDAAQGRLGAAIDGYRRVVERLPLPEYAIALGDTELAAGRTADARSDYGLVRAEQRLLAVSGVNTDVELAIFEADHGDPARAVALARRGYAAAPSVRSSDALGWALTRAHRASAGLAYARRALALGSRDPAFLYHAGIAARDAGHTAEARAWLARAVSLNPRFAPINGPRARRAVEALR